MRPISKSISYGYSKSVQLFVEEEVTESFELGVLGVRKKEKVENKKVFIVVISEYDINGDLYNLAEYCYDDYLKAVEHMHKIVLNFCYADLYQK